jgi:hypothetical protein
MKSQQRDKAEVPRRIHEIGLGNLRQLYAKGRVRDQKGALCAYLPPYNDNYVLAIRP